jgi:hypothetical protein
MGTIAIGIIAAGTMVAGVTGIDATALGGGGGHSGQWGSLTRYATSTAPAADRQAAILAMMIDRGIARAGLGARAGSNRSRTAWLLPGGGFGPRRGSVN